MRCSGGIDDDTIRAYVAGRLPEFETDAFELHLLGCSACQSAVEEGAGVRAAFAADEGSTGAPGDRSTGATGEARTGAPSEDPAGAGRRSHLGWTVPLAVAAAASAIFLLRSGDALVRLGGVAEAPPFTGAPVRETADSATALAAAGMRAYSAGRYREAADRLADAYALQPSPATAFFGGVSELMLDDPEAALGTLAGALSPAGNPYEAETRYFLAKAWLRQGDAASALGELGRILAAAEPLGSRARALADSVAAATGG